MCGQTHILCVYVTCVLFIYLDPKGLQRFRRSILLTINCALILIRSIFLFLATSHAHTRQGAGLITEKRKPTNFVLSSAAAAKETKQRRGTMEHKTFQLASDAININIKYYTDKYTYYTDIYSTYYTVNRYIADL